MPFQKVVVQYVQFGQDWKEIFWAANASVNATLAAVNTFNFKSAATSFRGSGVYIAGIRVSDVNQPRLAAVWRAQNSVPVSSGALLDVKNTALLWSLQDTSLAATRHIWLRGLAESATSRNPVTGQDEVPGGIATLIVNYIAQMVAAQLCIRQLQPLTGPPTYVFQPAQSVTVDGLNNVTITMKQPLVLGPSSRVVLSLFDPKTYPGLNGHYLAVNPASPTFGINYVPRLAAGTYPAGRGRMRVEEYRYLPIRVPLYTDPSNGFVACATRNTANNPFGGRGRKPSNRLRSR
jgi:hypothetical protein